MNPDPEFLEHPLSLPLRPAADTRHDLMALASGAAPRFFEIDHLPAKAHLFRLQRWSQDLMHAARSVEHPVNAGLRWEAWMSQAQQALSARR